MSIPEACIEAATVEFETGDEGPEARARRVILALAENMPPDAVDKAISVWLGDDGTWSDEEKASMWPAMRAAIAAFLKDVAGETP